MAVYTIVNQKTCIACGTCGEICSEIFDYTASGEAFVKIDDNRGKTEVSEGLLDDLEEAVISCPSNSIKVAKEPFVDKSDYQLISIN